MEVERARVRERAQRVSGTWLLWGDDHVVIHTDFLYAIVFIACTPGPGHVEMMLRATDDMPLNFGFSGKGNTSDSESLKEVLRSGAAGFKCKSSHKPTCFHECINLISIFDICCVCSA